MGAVQKTVTSKSGESEAIYSQTASLVARNVCQYYRINMEPVLCPWPMPEPLGKCQKFGKKGPVKSTGDLQR